MLGAPGPYLAMLAGRGHVPGGVGPGSLPTAIRPLERR
jgi:hypothetical protein